MKMADFSLFMESEMKNCGILTNITQEFVCNYEMETADFSLFMQSEMKI